MKYVPPLGAADENAPYIDGNPEYGIEGSPVPAKSIEDPQREIVEVITQAGLVPDDKDMTQLWQALLEVIRVKVPLATLARPGIVQPDGMGCTVDEAGLLSVLPDMRWLPTVKYDQPVLRVGPDGKLYLWLAASGPGVAGVGAKQPGAAGSEGFWLDYALSIAPPAPEVEKYDLGEFYYFRHPTLKPGFQPAQGGLLYNVPALYPKAWAYLQTVEGQKLCTTEAQWQAMVNAVWHTNADGSRVGWNGIGGAPCYVINTGNGTLRLPDLRGMYAEAAGDNSLGVGGVHGDAGRRIVALTDQNSMGGGRGILSPGSTTTGAFYRDRASNGAITGQDGDVNYWLGLDSARVAPVAAKNQPRAWGSLACVYLG